MSKKDAAAEVQAALSTMRSDRRFLWLWLTVATTLSVAGNVGHAWLTVPPGTQQGMAIGWAAAPPALLMLAIHGLPTLARMLGRDERDPLLTVVVWGVTVGAFGWSAFGIFTFTVAMGVPPQVAWVAPVVIDLSVFGATRGLVLTAPMAARMKAGIAPAESSAPAAPVQVNRQTTPASDPKKTPANNPASTRKGAVTTPENDPEPTRKGAVADPELTTLATRIAASGAVRQPVEVVAEILSELESGRGIKPTATALGLTPGVVRNVRDAAAAQEEHPADDERQDQPDRQLLAV